MHSHTPPSGSPLQEQKDLYAALRKNAGKLAIFAVICTALIAATDAMTRKVIARQAEANLQRTLGQMLPAEKYDNNLAESCILLKDRQYLGDDKEHPVYLARKGEVISGYIIESVAPNGYSGAIRMLTAVNADGSVNRVQILEHHETPGLGDKIERSKSGWIDSFNGNLLQGDVDKRWAVKKDGGMFDAFSGATITPRAVVGGVKNVLLLLKHKPQLLSQAHTCPVAGSKE